MSSAEEMAAREPIAATPINCLPPSASRTSELAISFEGEVYVFPAVTPEKVQSVLLLLGGRETTTRVPSSELLSQINNKGVLYDVSSQSIPRRIASLERFREKRKERCFAKKIRYTCRKEVASRMHRQNGQFASVKDTCKTSDENWDLCNSTPPESVCQHCGVGETSTPGMRQVQKVTLRELKEGGGHTLKQDEQGPLEVEPSSAEPANSYFNQGEELGGLRTPEQTKLVLLEFGSPSVGTEQVCTCRNCAKQPCQFDE